MIFWLHRIASDGVSTSGMLYGLTANDFICAVLEDAYHENKIWGQTRIPDGMYRLGWHASPRFDASYRKIVSAFGAPYRGMIEVQDVPGFTGVLLHRGNKPSDTDGCLLCGERVLHAGGGYYIPPGESAEGFKRAYVTLGNAMMQAETWLHVTDLDRKGTVLNGK